MWCQCLGDAEPNPAHIFLIEHCVFGSWRKCKHSIYVARSVKGAFRLGAHVLSSGLESCVVVFSLKDLLLLGYLAFRCLQRTESR